MYFYIETISYLFYYKYFQNVPLTKMGKNVVFYLL